MRNKCYFLKLIMIFLAIGALVSFSYAPPAMAQEGVISDEVIDSEPSVDVDRDAELEWGTADWITQSVPTWAFQGWTAAHDNVLNAVGNNRYCTSNCYLEAPTFLPTGVRVIAWELNAYDGGAGSVSLEFARCPINATHCTQVGAQIATSGTPGNTFVSRSTSHTVDNWNNSYIFQAILSAGSSYRIIGARVLYRLQISPAPSSASFNDVFPSDWYFQGVEALADSGITIGCGGNSFCPNVAVTRAQMAVFLSRALGLHYPR